MIRRLLVQTAAVALAAATVALLSPAPRSEAVGAADALGTYVLKLKGDAFDRGAADGRIDQRRVRGNATLVVTRTPDALEPNDLTVRIDLAGNLRGSVLDRATPTPALTGRGILVGDSLSVIGAGQSNFVNAVTLRFTKQGKRIAGWWLASFPGSDARSGFVAGAGLSFRGRVVRQPKTH